MSIESQLPLYLVDALVRYGEECRAQGREDASTELRMLRERVASVLGISEHAEPSLVSAPPPAPTVEEERPVLPYGSIGAHIRDIMLNSPANGLLINDIVARAQQTLHPSVTAQMAREALKRLKTSDEVICKDRRKWVATDKLRGAKDANEKGAPNGHAVSAPITAEGFRPSAFRQGALGLPS